MGLLGHWRRSVLGAGGVALLLPVGLALGIALTTAFGGETTLRSLGQVFAGPAVPRGDDAPGLEAPRSVPSVPVRPRLPSGRVAPGVPEGATAPVVPPSASGPANGTPESRPPAGDEDPPGSTPPPAGDPETPEPAPVPTPTPAPASPVHEAVQDAADAVPDLPGPAGDVADDAMQTVVDLIP
ncbi:MAG: hypothetical protein ACJ762_01415 [Solirubrobacteraceae bacterium]